MIPMVEEAYSTVLKLDHWRKGAAAIEKKTKTAAAPTTAPSSGRPARRGSSGVRATGRASVSPSCGRDRVSALIGCPAS